MLLLQQAWDNRAKILLIIAVGLAALSKRQLEQIQQLRAELEAKPSVQERVVTRVERGPVRIVKHVVEKPGAERIVTVEVLREAWSSETSSEHRETPACPAAPRAPRWILAASTDPTARGRSELLRAGVTLGGRLDLSYGHSITGPERHALDVAVRF
jgi:hypothetical protein